MLQALRDANLEPPYFDDRRSSFLVTLRNHTLLNPQAIVWLNQFADNLKDRVPDALRRRLAASRLRRVTAIGDLSVLDGRLLGFVCSSKCPGNVWQDAGGTANGRRWGGDRTGPYFITYAAGARFVR
jgi:hypothetical protein